jgi:hypothetical protein
MTRELGFDKEIMPVYCKNKKHVSAFYVRGNKLEPVHTLLWWVKHILLLLITQFILVDIPL